MLIIPFTAPFSPIALTPDIRQRGGWEAVIDEAIAWIVGKSELAPFRVVSDLYPGSDKRK